MIRKVRKAAPIAAPTAAPAMTPALVPDLPATGAGVALAVAVPRLFPTPRPFGVDEAGEDTESGACGVDIEDVREGAAAVF